MDLWELPLAAKHQKAGAKFASFAGWNMPMSYSGIVDEHNSVRTAVGLFDVTHMGQVEFLYGFYPYLRPEYVEEIHYDFTAYENPVEPVLTWQRRTCDQLAVWFYDPGNYVRGGAYFLQDWEPNYTVPVELIDTVSTISVFGQAVPDPAGTPAATPKGNFITGLEPMSGAGGIGQQISQWKSWVKYVRSIDAEAGVIQAQEAMEAWHQGQGSLE